MEVRSIKKEKMKEFLDDFHENSKKWYKKQMEEDFVFDEETQLAIINSDTNYFGFSSVKYIRNPTKLLCMKAIEQDGTAIEFIKNPTEEMCLKAVKNYGTAIRFIENPTEEMKLEAVKQNGNAIQYIENPTEEMILEAIKNSSDAINFIKNPSKELKLFAFKNKNYKYIDEFCNDDMKLKVLDKDGFAIQYIKNPTEEMKLKAVEKDGNNIIYINNPSEEVCIKAIDSNYLSILQMTSFITRNITDEFFDVCDKKQLSDPNSLNECFFFIPKKFITKKRALFMINIDPDNINILPKNIRNEILNEKEWLKKYVKDYCDDYSVDYYDNLK